MCAIVGILGQQEAATALYDALMHLQHRGQDAAGILTEDDYFQCKSGKGLVRDAFSKEDIAELRGKLGIAHARYPTAGGQTKKEVQPFWVNSPYGIAMVHNGNLTNTEELTRILTTDRHRYINTESDSEILLNLFADGFSQKHADDAGEAFFQEICEAIRQVFHYAKGSYSVVSLIHNKGLVAFRDPHGIRPLSIGLKKENGNTNYLFSSETSCHHALGFQSQGDVKPGEVIFINHEGQYFKKQLMIKPFRPCMFEYVYFSRPDALLDDVSVYRARLRLGQNLAQHWQSTYPELIPDVVIPVPFSANTSALSMAHALKIRYSEGLYKNPFIGRTFIMPNKALRKRSVHYKLSPQKTEIEGKSVLLVDDSIVRGTTSREIVKMVRACGAKAVYFASTCPPIKFPCFYGIDIPTTKELIASNKHIDQIRQYLDVDALLYQTEEDLIEAITRVGEHNIYKPCMACIDGDYVCQKKVTNREQDKSTV